MISKKGKNQVYRLPSSLGCLSNIASSWFSPKKQPKLDIKMSSSKLPCLCVHCPGSSLNEPILLLICYLKNKGLNNAKMKPTYRNRRRSQCRRGKYFKKKSTPPKRWKPTVNPKSMFIVFIVTLDAEEWL